MGSHHHRSKKEKPKKQKHERVKILPITPVSQPPKFCHALGEKMKRYGTRCYDKNRELADRLLNKYLERYHIKGTNNEAFWKLMGLCILLGKQRP